jgi:hypothetical protein
MLLDQVDYRFARWLVVIRHYLWNIRRPSFLYGNGGHGPVSVEHAFCAFRAGMIDKWSSPDNQAIQHMGADYIVEHVGLRIKSNGRVQVAS